MRTNIEKWYPAICLFGMSSSIVLATDTLEFIGSIAAEATVYEELVSENGGGYREVCVGNLGSLGSTRRAYIRYDLPMVPDGAELLRVQLELVQDRVRFIGEGAPKSATMRLRRVTTAWIEGAGTGAGIGPCRDGGRVVGINWAEVPAISGLESASALLPSQSPVTITIDTDDGTSNHQLIADILAWYADPDSNFGWRLLVEDVVDNARALVPGDLILTWSDPDSIFNDGFEE